MLKSMKAVLLIGSFIVAACSSQIGPSKIAIADDFFGALAAKDSDKALVMLAPDATLHAPFNPSGDTADTDIRSFPASLYVKAAIGTYDNLVFEDRKYSVADNGQTLWIEAEGKLRVAATGKPYENRYVFKLEFDGETISRITEYVNVATLVRDGVPAVAR